ncbi:MAG: DUF3822 family protein [Prevotella sp.]|nr:DUF3822 family protein [Prevotella sp.]
MDTTKGLDADLYTRITLRISGNAFSFACSNDTGSQVEYKKYPLSAGISMAANLKEAFGNQALLRQSYGHVQVMIDSPVMLVPLDELREPELEILYEHAFSSLKGKVLQTAVLPDLSAIAAYPVAKSWASVVEEHCPNARYMPLMQPVWTFLHHRSFSGSQEKLYAYFHDNRIEAFSFGKNRFKFYNAFDYTHDLDAVYFLLYVWKQLGYESTADTLFLCGSVESSDQVVKVLRQYLQQVFVVNPTAEFNRAPITQVAGMPLDMMTLFAKGR